MAVFSWTIAPCRPWPLKIFMDTQTKIARTKTTAAVTPITTKRMFSFSSIASAGFAVGMGEGGGVGRDVGNRVIVGRAVGRGDGW